MDELDVYALTCGYCARVRGVPTRLPRPGLLLPRKWDDESRKQDKGPHDQLAALFRRLNALLHGWTEALDHLAPTN